MKTRLGLRMIALLGALLAVVPIAIAAADWAEVTDGRLLEADKDANN